MRVGVYLGDFEPSVGGGFTFVSAVIDAFLAQAPGSSHRFTIFANRAYGEAIAERASAAGVDVCVVKSRRFAKAAMFARHYLPVSVLGSGGGWLERSARERSVQFMWFVGGGAYDALDTPYMATVWDVQHRTHPWFPEVAAQGIWDYREIALARFLRRASRIIAGTRVGVEQLAFYYQIPADRVCVLPHPTPISERAPEADVSATGKVARLAGKRFLFYPAQFWAHKNHANLIVALRLVRERLGDDIELALTGADKGNAAFVAEVAAELGLTSSVHFLGFVSRPELAYLYKHALALTYVSWSGPENMPPLEAFTYGCPVVNSDYPGAREQLGDAVRYVDAGDPSSIAEGIVEVVADGDKRARLVELGLQRSKRWTAADYVKGVFGIFDGFAPIRAGWR